MIHLRLEGTNKHAVCTGKIPWNPDYCVGPVYASAVTCPECRPHAEALIVVQHVRGECTCPAVFCKLHYR